METLQIPPDLAHCAKEIKQVMSTAIQLDVIVTPGEAFRMWRNHSAERHANWLITPADNDRMLAIVKKQLDDQRLTKWFDQPIQTSFSQINLLRQLCDSWSPVSPCPLFQIKQQPNSAYGTLDAEERRALDCAFTKWRDTQTTIAVAI